MNTTATSNAAIDALIAASPIADWLGFSASETNEGHLFHLSFREAHIGNPAIRAIHGGVVAAFLEFAAECALIAKLGDNVSLAAVNTDFDYMASSRAEDLHGAAHVTRLGRRIAFVEATAWQGDRSKPVAQGRFRFRVAD